MSKCRGTMRDIRDTPDVLYYCLLYNQMIITDALAF